MTKIIGTESRKVVEGYRVDLTPEELVVTLLLCSVVGGSSTLSLRGIVDNIRTKLLNVSDIAPMEDALYPVDYHPNIMPDNSSTVYFNNGSNEHGLFLELVNRLKGDI